MLDNTAAIQDKEKEKKKKGRVRPRARASSSCEELLFTRGCAGPAKIGKERIGNGEGEGGKGGGGLIHGWREGAAEEYDILP